MSRWQGRIDDLLYDGETVEETVDIDTSRLVVTSNRVLAFTPETDGEHFQQVDRPNVTGVTTAAGREGTMLTWSVALGALGAVLVAVGVVVDFDSLVGDVGAGNAEAGRRLGVGGVLETVQRLFELLAQLDDFMRLFGVLAVLGAVALFAVYRFLREPALVVETAGDDRDIRVPQPADDPDARTRLERALFPDAGRAGRESSPNRL